MSNPRSTKRPHLIELTGAPIEREPSVACTHPTAHGGPVVRPFNRAFVDYPRRSMDHLVDSDLLALTLDVLVKNRLSCAGS